MLLYMLVPECHVTGFIKVAHYWHISPPCSPLWIAFVRPPPPSWWTRQVARLVGAVKDLSALLCVTEFPLAPQCSPTEEKHRMTRVSSRMHDGRSACAVSSLINVFSNENNSVHHVHEEISDHFFTQVRSGLLTPLSAVCARYFFAT